MSDRDLAFELEHVESLEDVIADARRDQSEKSKRIAVEQLIISVRAPFQKLQIMAARHMPEFYLMCTDRRTEIHEAIFDICEDDDPDVRSVGYRTILELSKVAPSCHKKNDDVLCQLLQCGESPALV